MSLMMMLELDDQASQSVIRNALAQCGVVDLIGRENGFEGNFPSSNMYFFFESVQDGRLCAEGIEVEWLVGGKIVFVYVISAFDECSRQLHEFLQCLSKMSSARWVLSFQYESVCAVRDDGGLQWLKNF
jgi:hypothetical protein